MNVIDLFCGAGGFSKGFQDEGFNILLGIDNIAHKQRTYFNNIKPKYNMYTKEEFKMIENSNVEVHLDKKKYQIKKGDKVVINSKKIGFNELVKLYKEKYFLELEEKYNIKLMSAKDILDKIENEEVHGIIGSPPCTVFSQANGSKKIKEEIATLYNEYSRLVIILKPKWIVMENVERFYNSKYYCLLIEQLENNVYNMHKLILNSEDYGVPQSRERGFLIGTIENLTINEPKKIDKKEKVTIRNAISDIENTEKGKDEVKYTVSFNECTNYQKLMRNKRSKAVKNHLPVEHTKASMKKIVRLKNQLKESKKEKITVGLSHLVSYDSIAGTITSEFDNVSAKGYSIHTGANINRTITCREAARLQSFPDDYIFYGENNQISKQIGDAVPPLLAQAIARIIKVATLVETSAPAEVPLGG